MPSVIKKGWIYSCLAIFLIVCLVDLACKSPKKPPPESVIAASPEDLSKKVTDIIKSSIEFASSGNNSIDEYHVLQHQTIVSQVYEKNKYTAVWSRKEQWNPLADSLFSFIDQAKLYGLFPEDYHSTYLDSVRAQFLADTSQNGVKRDAVKWASADILLTDAFFHLVKDLKLGRLPQDSVTLRKDSVLTDEFYLNRLAIAQMHSSLSLVFHALEPSHRGYEQLKAAIPAFLETADYKEHTVVPSPKGNSPEFKRLLQKRLFEAGLLASDTTVADSVTVSNAITAFQRSKNITVDGKVGEETVRVMNFSDRDRFVRIAIAMDRYKMLPDSLPARYVWVNLPGYYMEFWENDTLRLTSKIICGKPLTRTPLLTSAISELVTYPQWTVPNSIIVKEILPGIKKDSAYLAKKGFSLINSKGDEVNPDSVDWWKYKKGIPYKVVQGSGDDNALGILKFNFPNKYAVYMHDTNQRYLFAQSKRSLSHGCVRVQDWEKLAYSIVQYDYKDRPGPKPSPVEDSLSSWLQKKEKHSILVRNRLPVYIRYITVEGREGRLRFYDDMYGEDKGLQEKYFAGK